MSIKILSIKKSSDFGLINKLGNKFFLKDLIIIQYQNSHSNYSPIKSKNSINKDKLIDLNQQHLKINKNHSGCCRIGYTISKSVSKLSTTRNLIKRRLKSILKNNHPFLQRNCDYVFIARKSILESKFSDLEKNIKFALKKLTKHEQK